VSINLSGGGDGREMKTKGNGGDTLVRGDYHWKGNRGFLNKERKGEVPREDNDGSKRERKKSYAERRKSGGRAGNGGQLGALASHLLKRGGLGERSGGACT